jgi:hypothetical protein
MRKVIYKMKAYVALFAVTTAISVAFVSCDKNSNDKEPEEVPDPPVEDPSVDEPPVITWDSPLKSDKEALALSLAPYYDWGRLSSSFSFFLESATESTVSFEGADSEAGPKISRFETDADVSYTSKIFTYLYVSVGLANKAIARLDSSYVNADLTQGVIDLAKGRAKFIRGLDYLYLVQLWGEVPLFTSPDPTDAERKTRRPIDSVYTQVVKDLTEAAELLPGWDVIRSNPTRGSANAILARAYLQWASKPLSQEDVIAIVNSKTDPAPPQWDNAKLQKVVEHADKVISSGAYQLEANFEDLWGTQSEDKSPEHIFTIHHDGDGNGDSQGNHQTHCPFTQRFNLYSDNHIGPADVTLLDWFEAGDKRKRFSITDSLYNQDEKTGTATPDRAENYQKYLFRFPVTSPRYAKWIHRTNRTTLVEVAPGSSAGQPNNIDRVEIRLADVLLYKAEAKFYLNSGDKGLAEINQLRTRAGIEPLTALTQDALEKEYLLEQFFEQRNWVNLTRWHKLIQKVKSVDRYEYFKEDYKDVASIEAKFGSPVSGTTYPTSTNYAFFAKIYTHLHKKYDNVSGKFYRFPIPNKEQVGKSDLNITPQNPGF